MIQFSSILLCIGVLLVLYCPVQSSENAVTTLNGELNEDKIKGIQDGGNIAQRKLNKKSIALRVVRGYLSGRKGHPYLAYVGDKNGYIICGGSIISSEFILTAAHCLANATTGEVVSIEDRSVFLGVHDRFNMENATTYKIIQAIVHENYLQELTFQGYYHHDIALIKIYPQIVYNTFIQPICLTDNDMWAIDSSTVGIVQGWGTDQISFEGPRYPMKTNLTIISGGECNKYQKYQLPDHDTVVCGLVYERPPEQVSGSCYGDSGGPFFIKPDKRPVLQIGIVSWLEECAVYHKTNIFTRISYFLPWIFSYVPRSTVCDTYLNT